jgi:flagellar biosynthetic protein FliR
MEVLALSFSLVLSRTLGFVSIMPMFGRAFVPKMVRVGLAFALAVFFFGMPGTMLAEDFTQDSLVLYALILLRESVLGAMMGFVFSLITVPARVAGEFIAQEMGMALGSMTDPGAENPSGLLGVIFEVLAMILLLGIDGHHIFFASLHASFARWPIGGTVIQVPTMNLLAGLSRAEEAGILIGAPVLLCSFMTTILLTLLARAAPQLNLLTIGFTMRVVVGMLAILAFLPDVIASLTTIMSQFGFLVQSVLS